MNAYVVISAEFPTMVLQNMRTRDKMEVNAETLPVNLKEWSEAPGHFAHKGTKTQRMGTTLFMDRGAFVPLCEHSL